MSTLSQESVQKLAQVIAPQVFDYMSEDGRFIDGLMNTIEPAIVSVIGHVSPDLVGELGVAIMDSIGVPDINDPYAVNNIWKTRYEVLYRYVKENYASDYVDGAEYGTMNETTEVD